MSFVNYLSHIFLMSCAVLCFIIISSLYLTLSYIDFKCANKFPLCVALSSHSLIIYLNFLVQGTCTCAGLFSIKDKDTG